MVERCPCKAEVSGSNESGLKYGPVQESPDGSIFVYENDLETF